MFFCYLLIVTFLSTFSYYFIPLDFPFLIVFLSLSFLILLYLLLVSFLPSLLYIYSPIAGLFHSMSLISPILYEMQTLYNRKIRCEFSEPSYTMLVYMKPFPYSCPMLLAIKDLYRDFQVSSLERLLEIGNKL